MTSNFPQDINCFLVCGLGSLGQYCVALLKEFGVKVNAIEAVENQKWQIPNLPDLLDKLVIGDFRQPKILEQAGIRKCQAIIIVTNDERVNIAAAFAARSLNPHVRLVIRSAQENLNELLSQNLGNFVAFEAAQLPAKSFVLAALGTQTRGFFTLEDRLLRVVKEEIDPMHHWCNHREIQDLNNSSRRVFIHVKAGKPLPKAFYQWKPNAQILPGDTLAYIEIADNRVPHSASSSQRSWGWRTIATEMKACGNSF